MRKYLYGLATDKHKGLLPGIFKAGLLVLSFIYGLAIRSLIILSDLRKIKLPCKVISVGNISLGGTGKTVIVGAIAQYLKDQGHKVAIVTRGYGRKILNSKSEILNYEEMGDEASMLKKRLKDIPVIVDANRARAVRLAAKEYGVDTVILDDGFQQWRLVKDLDIVAIDSRNLFGNKHMIPRGILREPLSSLKRSHIFMITKYHSQDISGIKEMLSRINPNADIFISQHMPTGFYGIDNLNQLLGLETLNNQTVALFSGIADPNSFEDSIRGLGLNIGLHLIFPDHHHYSQRDLNNIFKQSQEKNINTIITTEKDAPKLSGLKKMNYRGRVLVLRIELKVIDENQRFHNRLLGIYSS